MIVKDIFIPATIDHLKTIDASEIRGVTLRLPTDCEVAGTTYPSRATMRPGNAFLAKPFGARTGKERRRMYTRSNSSHTHPGLLETIINHTHQEKADTSIWWQGEQLQSLPQEGGVIAVRTVVSPNGKELVVAQNTSHCAHNNLQLEPDDEWSKMRFLGLAFSTGITPFLAHLRYMKAFQFGKSEHAPGAHYTLIASARNPRQLLEQEELLELVKLFPANFNYFPVLTREWPADWVYGKGRIMRAKGGNGNSESIDLGPLLEVEPNLGNCHIRFCGNRTARGQLMKGLEQHHLPYLGLRSEVW